MSAKNFCGRTRREMLWESGCGFPAVALASMLGQDLLSGSAQAEGLAAYKNPLAPKAPHHDPDATACIFLYMYGGPSQVDTFD